MFAWLPECLQGFEVRHRVPKPGMEAALEVTVEHLGAVQFEVTARGHKLVSDQPAENKGFDEGMTPPELLLASLGSCAAFYAVDYLVRNNLGREGVKARVTADKVKGPFRLDNFRIEVEVPGELSPEQGKGLEEAVHRCLIHNTLLHPPQMEIAIQTPVHA
jgi:putative redox protein